MDEINSTWLREIALRLAQNALSFKKRYFLAGMRLGKEPRIKVLRGFRGLGKTTALLQMLDAQSIYFSMDNPLAEVGGIYALGKKFILDGCKTLLIDEVHYCKKWKEETKALYDEFPQAHFVLSGSAPLAFEPERRYEIIDVEPLSLREYAELEGKKIPASEGWKNINETLEVLAQNQWLYEAYSNYLNGGALPIYFSYKEKTLESIYSAMQKSVRDDAAFLPNVDGEMRVQMEKTLVFLATSSLGEFSINSLSKTIGLNKNKAYYMVSLLQAMKILRLVMPLGKGAKLVRGEPKLMFYHPVMRNAVCRTLGMQPDKGAMREEMAVFCLAQRGWRISTIKGMKKSPDYIIEKGAQKFVIEIGRASKGSSQLRGFSEKTLLLEDRQLILLGLF